MNEGYQEAIEEIQEGNDESQQRTDEWNRNEALLLMEESDNDLQEDMDYREMGRSGTDQSPQVTSTTYGGHEFFKWISRES